MPDLKQYIYDLSHDEVVEKLIEREIIGEQKFIWLAAVQTINAMARRGYWCEIKSPFAPGDDWFAGFTPHNTTVIPVNQMHGSHGPIAVLRAALLAIMNKEQEAENVR